MSVIFDISEWQEELDWDAIADEADAVILRIGRDGGIMDEMFEEHLANAQAHRIPVGVYYYSSAETMEEAREDANYCCQWISNLLGYIPSFGIWYDVEDKSNAACATTVCCEWLEQMMANGYNIDDIGIYASYNWLSSEAEGLIMIDELPQDTPLWVAQYCSSCDLIEDEPNSNVKLWQYTDSYSEDLPYDASMRLD